MSKSTISTFQLFALTRCYASRRDSECVHARCPMNAAICAERNHAARHRGNDPTADCPLWTPEQWSDYC